MNYFASKIAGTLTGGLNFLTGTPAQEGVADFLKGPGNGMLDGITAETKGMFASTYALVSIIAVGVGVIALIIAAILLIAQKKASDKSENKSWIVTILFGVAIAAGATSIISLFSGIGSGL